MVMERSRCGVREEEPTKTYIIVVFASEMGHGIILIAVRKVS